MTAVEQHAQPEEQVVEKGLKAGALGLISTTIIATASVAPAYSIAATLGLVVIAVGLQSPAVAVLAFVPMLLTSFAYSELNKADPDCGTTFTWAARAFGPRSGWAGGWGIIAADVLIMASLAQVAGQYVFFLVAGPDSKIGMNPASGWVLLVGVLWIVVMTYICYRGIEVSANFQKVLLGIELVMLAVLSVTALVKVYSGHHPGSIHPAWSWFNPFHISSFSAFTGGVILMVFIYWGWDTGVAVNEETKDRNKTPGRAAIISTVLLLITYALVVTSAQAFAGVGDKGAGLQNPANIGDVLSVQGSAIFGSSGFGGFLTRLLFLMVLSSAAASTQTTILPTARTTLSMAVYKAIPRSFAKIHPRYLTPTVSTLVMGGISIVLYAAMNYISKGAVIADAVTAVGLYIAFYYGLTGFTCAWYYRRNLTSSARNLFMQGILPVIGALMLWFLGGWSVWLDYDVATQNSYTTFSLPGLHWQIGGVFTIAFFAAVAGLAFYAYCRITGPAFFRKQTLTRATPTLVPETDGPVIGGGTVAGGDPIADRLHGQGGTLDR
jgi:amino acid transporter